MKKFILGMLVGAVLMVSTSAFAALEKITAYLRPDFSVSLDGEQIALKHPIVIVNGSSYLPLKEVAEIVKLNVNWNDETMTAELATKPDEIVTEPTQDEATVEPEIIETTYEDAPAISINGVIYFSLFKTKYFLENNRYIYYNSTNQTINFIAPDKTETSIDATNPENFRIYKDRSFLNIKYYDLLIQK